MQPWPSLSLLYACIAYNIHIYAKPSNIVSSPVGFKCKPKRHTITISMRERERAKRFGSVNTLAWQHEKQSTPKSYNIFYKVNSPVSTCTNLTTATNFPLHYRSCHFSSTRSHTHALILSRCVCVFLFFSSRLSASAASTSVSKTWHEKAN